MIPGAVKSKPLRRLIRWCRLSRLRSGCAGACVTVVATKPALPPDYIRRLHGLRTDFSYHVTVHLCVGPVKGCSLGSIPERMIYFVVTGILVSMHVRTIEVCRCNGQAVSPGNVERNTRERHFPQLG